MKLAALQQVDAVNAQGSAHLIDRFERWILTLAGNDQMPVLSANHAGGFRGLIHRQPKFFAKMFNLRNVKVHDEILAFLFRHSNFPLALVI